MTSHEIDRARRTLSGAATLIAGGITLVSLLTTFSLFRQSFADWPSPMNNVLAFASAAAIELAACLLTWALTNALAATGEKVTAGIGLALLVGVMALNLITHTMQIRGVPLKDWQQTYVNFIGPGVIIGTLIVLIVLQLVRPETRERELERRMMTDAKLAMVNWQQRVLQSPEFEAHLDRNYRAQVYAKAAQLAGLPPVTRALAPDPTQTTIDALPIEEPPRYVNGKAHAGKA